MKQQQFQTFTDALNIGYNLATTPKGQAWFKEGHQITQPFDANSNNKKILQLLNDALQHKAAPEQPQPDYAFPGQTTQGFQEGMTLRDWFAGMAMQKMQADTQNFSYGAKEWHRYYHDVAQMAYMMADAMMAVREKDAAKSKL